MSGDYMLLNLDTGVLSPPTSDVPPVQSDREEYPGQPREAYPALNRHAEPYFTDAPMYMASVALGLGIPMNDEIIWYWHYELAERLNGREPFSGALMWRRVGAERRAMRREMAEARKFERINPGRLAFIPEGIEIEDLPRRRAAQRELEIAFAEVFRNLTNSGYIKDARVLRGKGVNTYSFVLNGMQRTLSFEYGFNGLMSANYDSI